LFISLLCVTLSSCKKEHEKDSWTSADPLSIPLKTRQAEYAKGNLVANPSFEQADIGKNDSMIRDFSLSHWQVIGQDVQLVDVTRSKIYDSTEAYQGTHAIKIVRTEEGVKEIDNPSEGVLSDFIKVIPANYNFYFDIRLDRIIPDAYPSRMQSRIGKGIDIRLEFYDKNKKKLDPGMYFEYVNKKVDNSFKGFAFSNDFFINKFNWARVRGRTWAYPFSEGDLPDGCRYIKIFLGLKCSGTMWIDNIDFRLSKWNFTPMERMDSMFRKKYNLTELMIPRPKAVANLHYIDLKDKRIDLVYGGPQSPETTVTFALLQKRFARAGDSVKVTGKPASGTNGLQIILMRKTPGSTLFDSAFQAIANKDQGYFIRREGNKIYLGANQPKGFFYAASSLCQLIDEQNAVLDYADITDYPDFTGRSSVLMNFQNKWTLQQHKLSDSAITAALRTRDKNLERQVNDIDFYAFYKINTFYSLYFSLSQRWWDPGHFYDTFFRKIDGRCSRYGDMLHTAVQINPYYHIAMEQQEDTLSDSLRRLFSHGTADGFEKIKAALTPALDAGAKTVMVCADDYVPHAGIMRGDYVLFTKSDKAQFTNLAAAQDYMLNKLKRWLDQKYGDIRLEFVPPAYNNVFIDYGRGSAETYFRDLSRHLDSSVVLVWTGNTIRSLSYDLAGIRRATGIYNRKPMIWDNSPYARSLESKNGGYPMNYPGKSVLCDLFEPFDIQYPKNFPAYVDSRYYSNLGGFGEINKIKYMTFADFAWNARDYNPDFSLFKALLQYVGRKNAELLLKFNDAYFKFVSSQGQLRMDLEHDPHFDYPDDQRKKAENEMDNMKQAFQLLKPMDNSALKSELENAMNAKIDAWRKLSQRASSRKNTGN
jgi:hypothetical protein